MTGKIWIAENGMAQMLVGDDTIELDEVRTVEVITALQSQLAHLTTERDQARPCLEFLCGSQQAADHAKLNHRLICNCQLFIARGDPTILFQPPDATLHMIAFAIRSLIKIRITSIFSVPAFSLGDYGNQIVLAAQFVDPLAIVPLVAYD